MYKRQTFENIYPTYTMLKTFILNEKEVRFDRNHMTIISPDHGGMGRAVYYANALSLDVGMYYKRRDLTTVVNGKNPILQHEYIGSDVAGKDVFIVDDMIASGDSVLDIAKDMSLRGARKIFIAATFAFFTEGVEKFNDYYRSGMFTRVYATNLTYLSDEVKAQPWFCEVDMSKHLSLIHISQYWSCAPLYTRTVSGNPRSAAVRAVSVPRYAPVGAMTGRRSSSTPTACRTSGSHRPVPMSISCRIAALVGSMTFRPVSRTLSSSSVDTNDRAAANVSGSCRRSQRIFAASRSGPRPQPLLR